MDSLSFKQSTQSTESSDVNADEINGINELNNITPTKYSRTIDNIDDNGNELNGSGRLDKLKNGVESMRKKKSNKNRVRCHVCNKKLGMKNIPFKCKCSSSVSFCTNHRFPEEHECVFDYRREGAKSLSDKLVKVVGAKMNKL